MPIPARTVPVNTNTIYSVPTAPTVTTAPTVNAPTVPEEEWWGFVTEERPSITTDPSRVTIHLHGQYNPVDSPYWPVGYVAKPITVVKGHSARPRGRVPKRKRVTKRKGHQHGRECLRLQRAHEDDPENFPYKIEIGARHQIYRVPTPTATDLDLPNRRVINGVVWTYRRINKDYQGEVKTGTELDDAELEHAVLSNFRAAKDLGKYDFHSSQISGIYFSQISENTFSQFLIFTFFDIFSHRPADSIFHRSLSTKAKDLYKVDP